MNPPNDIGKRELPPGLRNRFTEFFVDELENPADLSILVSSYLKNISTLPPINDIISFYLDSRKASIQNLCDGSHKRPRYSLRTLVRTLEFCKTTLSIYGFRRALFEGTCMSFLTQLDSSSIPIMEKMIEKYLQKG
jgi:midasin